MEDEYLDLVDEKDNVINKMKRSEVYLKSFSNFRVVNLFIVNSKGQLWIPRRSSTKRIFPLCLDMSMGGHVESGETYEDALKREIKEELNLDLDKINYELLGKLSPSKNKVSAFMKVYKVKLNKTPNYNEDDFIEAMWIKPKDLLKKIKSGEKAKDDLPKIVEIFRDRL